MAGQETMREVELREEPDASAAAEGGDAGDARRRARRRRLLRWWPAAAAAVVVAGTVQVVLDARERDRVAAAREVQGVVRYDVGPDLRATPLGEDEADPRPTAGVEAGGLLVAGEGIDFGRPRRSWRWSRAAGRRSGARR